MPKTTKHGGVMEIGVSVLPRLPRHAGDRNRTSPFAFTGNKFEFRAVGGSQSIAGPNTALNTIVAESLDYIATNLESAVNSGKTLNHALQELLPAIIRENKKVIFNGDNYTDEWQKDAERRGLPNIKNSVDAYPVVIRKDTVELMTKYRVFSERELQSRHTIMCESYTKTVNIEGQLTSMMCRTQVLPACLKYQADVAQAVNATKAAGVDNKAQVDLLRSLTQSISEFQGALGDLDKALAHHAEGSPQDHARYMRDKVLPAMTNVRNLSDKLEATVADEYWPLPSYREMLFIK
jgi:glutamine synthetase